MEPEDPAQPEGPTEPIDPAEPTALPDQSGGGEPPASEPPASEPPAEPDAGEEPGTPDEPEEPEAPACAHIHDETCGYAEAREARPCGYLCPLCLTGWQWNNGEVPLVWNEDAGQWGLGIPGASAEEPVTREMLEALLPASVTGSTKAGTAVEVGLIWDFSQFSADTYPGVYKLTASLDGEYALTETAPKLEVLLDLGEGDAYEDTRGYYPGPVQQVPVNQDGRTHKFVSDWKYQIPTGGTEIINGEGENSYKYFTSLALLQLSAFDKQGLIDAITAALPKRIEGTGYYSPDLINAGFELKPGAPASGSTTGYVQIIWNVADVINNAEWPIQGGTDLTFYADPVSKDGYLLRINTNDSAYKDNADDKADTAEAYDVLNLTVTIRDINPAAHIVTPAHPENVTVNLFDYWVEGYGENPTADKTVNPLGGDILGKSDVHYHEEGGEGVLGTTPTGYSTEKDWNKGINQGHLLLFGDGLIHAGLWNKGAGENCRYGKAYAGMEGIVKNVLTEDGYPEINLDLKDAILTGNKSMDYSLIKDYMLTGDHKKDRHPTGDGYTYDSSDIKNLSNTVQETWGTGKTSEPLQYLFEPANGSYKKAYTNVTGLFQLDEDGYYYYNMRENFAEFSQDGGNHFILYDAPATTRTDGDRSIGNFFPFNKGSEVFNGLDSSGNLTSSVYCANNAMNHHLGMTVEVAFRQPAGGKINTGSKGQQPMTFQFSGDDDVWVFIDDVLVLDLGGIHSELYGTIDFSTGDVYIGRSFNTNGIPSDPADPAHMVTHTNLRELYTAASKEGETKWSGNTYASNTSHTLKMFYLERGNYDSSIALRFNLQPLLHQRIEKVDQDGNPLPGGGFALYPAGPAAKGDSGAIQCLYTDTGVNGETFYIKQAGSTPLVTLETDQDGSAVFKDGPGESDYFNFADRGDQYYVLKETHAPAGYRSQPVDIVLRYDTDTAMLSVANRWTTGAYACSVTNVSGTSKLTYGQFSNGWIEAGTEDVPREDRANGLVVAVPLLKQKSSGSWLALSGSNLTGFQSTPAGSSEETWRASILLAALKQAENSHTAGWHLNWDSKNGRLCGTMFDLPGLASRYLLNNPNGDMQMIYGIISAATLSALGIQGSTSDERYDALRRYVKEHSADEAYRSLAGGFRLLSVTQFNRDFRSMIYIPNERRELQVWKVDQDGKGVNGAQFGLYTDAACTGTPAAAGTTATVDGRDGVLVFSPSASENTPGQAKMVWAGSTNTRYYLKEMLPPSGYQINNTTIPVVVGQYSIYADAGVADDGVTVTAGVGKLTQTMRQYAMGNDVDITLQDITAYMQTQPSDGFSLEGWNDVKLEHTAGADVLRSMNLHFGKNALVDYGLHDEDGGKNLSPFFVTDTGFVRARVEQMAETGRYENVNKDANRDDLGDTDLTNLFSLLNVVVVTDQTAGDTNTGKLTISKQVTGSGLSQSDYTTNFSFTIELRDSHGAPLSGQYEYRFYGADKVGFIDSENNTLLLHHDDSVTILGLPVGTQYTVTENKADGWHVKPAGGTLSGTIANGQTSEAKFENSKAPFQEEPKPETGSFSISKTIKGEDLTAEDHQQAFVFTVTLTDAEGQPLTDSYPYTAASSGGTIANGGTISLKGGESATITGLPVGTKYTVTENKVDGWETAPANGASGEISKETSGSAPFTNTKTTVPPEEPKTGRLTVSKIVAGVGVTEEDRARDFTFTLLLKDAEGEGLSGSYPYTVSESGAAGHAADTEQKFISSGDTFTLRHNQSITISELPEGAQFEVTEMAVDGWHVTRQDGRVASVIAVDETALATFTNVKETPPENPPPENPPPENPPPKDPEDPVTPPKAPDDPTEPPEDPDEPKEPPTDPPEDPEQPTETPEEPPEIPETPEETPEPPVETPEEPQEEQPEEPQEEYPTELPDPNDPDSPDVITILEDGVPKTYKKIWDPETEAWMYILDDEIPLANMDFPLETPATSDDSRTGLWLLLNGLSFSGLAAIFLTKLRRNKDSK
ncbi:MAG: fibro-slime domain-containing protein [Oscillospiraceae bacterium]|nr:fibro-slime domain-containing protein [Oscillospiraceae bacterium]